ncbi:MAG: hypothetical protein WC688_04200 [Parachlamydiales bacterium]
MRVLAQVVGQYQRRKDVSKKLIQSAENYALKMKCSHIELSSDISSIG